MIQIEKIVINEMRGIRHLELSLNSRSFLISGKNGSGKSGVVDAIDFAFTGDMLRLNGAGLGGVSLAKHGPHVTRRDDAGSAKVELTLRDTDTDKTAVLRRDIKSRVYTLTPEDPNIKAHVDLVQQHPELTLSRREIIKFIVAEPGKRATEVQALLKLGRLDEVRKSLKTADNTIASKLRESSAAVGSTEGRLRTHLDIEDLVVPRVLEVVNRHRATLDLDSLTALDATAVLSVDVENDMPESNFNRASALRDLDALRQIVADSSPIDKAATELVALLVEIDDLPAFLESISRVSFLSTGVQRVKDASCPLCGLQWESADELRRHLDTEIAAGQKANHHSNNIKRAAEVLTGLLAIVRSRIGTVEELAQIEGDTGLTRLMRDWSDDLLAFSTRVAEVKTAVEEVGRLREGPVKISELLQSQLTAMFDRIEALPDQSAKDNARTFLIVAQDRWKALQAARSRQSDDTKVREASKVVYNSYCDAVDQELANLYDEVQEEFAAFYREINADDESGFKAQLEPSAGKLDLSVDFYGHGMFPPAAYHSEGHQDGMGICLYLALVKRILGDDFRFAVLDDVLMSIDSNHRRQFCELLQKHFPDVQFIITTHDRIWAEQIKRSGLISGKAHVRFHGWSVGGGPVVDIESEAWEKITQSIDDDDISGAAARLRRHLEWVLSDLAVRLHGKVFYKPEGGADLGDLNGAVEGALGKLIAKAQRSANIWNNEDAKERARQIKEELAAKRFIKDDEKWAVNPAVHFNEWEDMQSADFRPVVQAWHEFISMFECSSCGSFIYVALDGRTEDSLRCQCGMINFNLRDKK